MDRKYPINKVLELSIISKCKIRFHILCTDDSLMKSIVGSIQLHQISKSCIVNNNTLQDNFKEIILRQQNSAIRYTEKFYNKMNKSKFSNCNYFLCLQTFQMDMTDHSINCPINTNYQNNISIKSLRRKKNDVIMTLCAY